MNHVVIARYDENVSWTTKLNMPYTIIQKQPNLNVGTESWAFVHFIIENYENLPDRILFVHGHENSYHQDHPTWYIANNLNWNLEYMNINTRRFDEQYISSIDDFEDIERHYRKSYKLWIADNWYDLYGSLPRPHTLFFLGYNQFVLSKKNILRHPKDFYKRMLKWLETTDIDRKMYVGPSYNFDRAKAYVSGRICEYTWHYIFTGDPEERLGNYLM